VTAGVYMTDPPSRSASYVLIDGELTVMAPLDSGHQGTDPLMLGSMPRRHAG
jgi:hypothetical protein